ncbi:MAG TPA: site-2 protease family protein [Chitinophaga sp.]|uniref:site-2 protease family protein n=1 Tax=Chitinophaga sp. TaxID=1869181 RepID=UPI002DB717D9|nr:site-2 protease family protein [Chitinophaga sp.]HEU4552992.1 site-2 protease family protein [Chitinophaga sp.]
MKKIRLIKILGVQVNLHWTFTLLIAWILVVQMANGAGMAQVMWALLGIAAIFTCVVLHELGHVLVAAYYHIKTRSITLYPIGGLAIMEKLPGRPVEEMLISLAGPLVNLVIAALLLPFIPYYVPFWKTAVIINNIQPGNLLLYLHTINIMLALFNLIPAFPLDGGRVLRGLLGLFLHNGRPTAIAILTGRIIAAAFIITGLFSFNLLLPFIGVLIILADAAEEQLVYLRTAVKGIKLREFIIRDYTTIPHNLSIQATAAEFLPGRHQYFVITSPQGMAGVTDRNTLLHALAQGWHHKPVAALISAPPKTLDENSLADEVVEQLVQQRTAALPVMCGNRLAGILNLDSIIEYLLIHDTSAKTQNQRGAVARMLQQF